MVSPLIKICGIRDPDMATRTAQAGANFIGIVFHPASKRFVDLPQAKLIVTAASNAGAIPVAVFVNHSAKEMQSICEVINISWIQLHGVHSQSQHHLLPKEYHRIFVKSVIEPGEIDETFETGFEFCDPNRDYLMFDNALAGGGKRFNWQNFKFSNKKNFRWFLAGGLTADNIQEAISQLHPNGVDVSSGVESEPGVKDLKLIEKFIQAARSGEKANS